VGRKSKNQKGCALCKPHKDHRCGRAFREPWAVLRKIGKKRRIKRGEIPA
jgi:hypothetical protein